MAVPADLAVVGGRLFTGLVDVASDLGVLDGEGVWVVVLPFDAPPVCARFTDVGPAPPWSAPEWDVSSWSGLDAPAWRSSLDRHGHAKGVTVIREAIVAGDVYQVNLCRRLSTEVDPQADVLSLGAALAVGNPAPHSAIVRLPSAGLAVASASPECFLRRRGRVIESRPIKGTATNVAGLSGKDRAENVMIVDLVRNDLGRVCEHGSVEVTGLCEVERHPGLAHLVSTVRGHLRPEVDWAGILEATFPPGSVTGAPKLAALDLIAALEPVPRGVYCGAVGWVDAASGDGDLNVAIRTFWLADGLLHLGTGGGITWDSVPRHEWEETELKARGLLGVAAGP